VPVADARKTVTVLFADVVGSTPLGERHDPEQLRRVMSRYWLSVSLGSYRCASISVSDSDH
jgi:class 3 adenylate cyclase